MTGVEENATGQAGTGGALADAMATPDQPAPASNRIVTLDLIRGIAVLGILFANITAFGQPLMVYFWPPAMPGGASETDKLAWLV